MTRHTVPKTAIIPLLRNLHMTAASVAVTGIAAEFLVVFLAGLPYRPGQLRTELLFCGIGSLCYLALMIAQMIVVNLWRRHQPYLPRRPDTNGAVMTNEDGTAMVRDIHRQE